MSTMNYEPYQERLSKRRSKVIRTLDHVKRELAIVDENKEWIDEAAYKSRCALLDSLATWYVDEASRIDDALGRITEGHYGICLSCHEAIDPLRLEASPEASFCAGCQSLREALGKP